MSNNVLNFLYFILLQKPSLCMLQVEAKLQTVKLLRYLLPPLPPKKPNDGNEGAVFILGWADFRMDLTGGIF